MFSCALRASDPGAATSRKCLSATIDPLAFGVGESEGVVRVGVVRFVANDLQKVRDRRRPVEPLDRLDARLPVGMRRRRLERVPGARASRTGRARVRSMRGVEVMASIRYETRRPVRAGARPSSRGHVRAPCGVGRRRHRRAKRGARYAASARLARARSARRRTLASAVVQQERLRARSVDQRREQARRPRFRAAVAKLPPVRNVETAAFHASRQARCHPSVSAASKHDIELLAARCQFADDVRRCVVEDLVGTERRTNATFVALHVATTCAPRCLATCTAKCPTPPAAPLISTRCPAASLASSKNACAAEPAAMASKRRMLVRDLVGNRRDAVRARSRRIRRSFRRGSNGDSEPNTRSPTCRGPGPPPTATMSPANRRRRFAAAARTAGRSAGGRRGSSSRADRGLRRERLAP